MVLEKTKRLLIWMWLKIAYHSLFHRFMTHELIAQQKRKTTNIYMIFLFHKYTIVAIESIKPKGSCIERFETYNITTLLFAMSYLNLSDINENLSPFLTCNQIHNYNTHKNTDLIIPQNKLFPLNNILLAVTFSNK